MRNFTRRQAPTVLTEPTSKTNALPRWEHWGNQFAANRQKEGSFPFQWPEVNGVKLNLLLQDDLKGQTDEHCSFCDNFPLTKGNFSIDHFKPKSKSEFHNLVCAWENLYFACGHCQASKLEKYHDHLLRPDEPTFDFYAYFELNLQTQEINVLPKLVPGSLAYQQAEKTINLFDLNDKNLKDCRRIEYSRYITRPNPVLPGADPLKLPEPDSDEITNFAFRFMYV